MSSINVYGASLIVISGRQKHNEYTNKEAVDFGWTLLDLVLQNVCLCVLLIIFDDRSMHSAFCVCKDIILFKRYSHIRYISVENKYDMVIAF